MARWRYNGKKIKEIKEFNLDQLKIQVKLEPGDMVEVVSGEFPYRSLSLQMKWVLHGDHNRFSVVQSTYLKKRWGDENHCLLMPLNESDLDLGLIQIHYDPYMRAKVRIFPVDTVDSW